MKFVHIFYPNTTIIGKYSVETMCTLGWQISAQWLIHSRTWWGTPFWSPLTLLDTQLIELLNSVYRWHWLDYPTPPPPCQKKTPQIYQIRHEFTKVDHMYFYRVYIQFHDVLLLLVLIGSFQVYLVLIYLVKVTIRC